MGTKLPNVRMRGDTYFARLAVPPELRTVIGTSELTEAVGTSRKEALQRSRFAIRRLQAQLDAARAELPASDPNKLRTAVRAFYQYELDADADERAVAGSRERDDFMRHSRNVQAARLRRVAAGESDGARDDEEAARQSAAAIATGPEFRFTRPKKVIEVECDDDPPRCGPPIGWTPPDVRFTAEDGLAGAAPVERSEAESLISYAADRIGPLVPWMKRAELLRLLAAIKLEAIDAAARRDAGHPPPEPKHHLLGGTNPPPPPNPQGPRFLDRDRSRKPLSALLVDFHVERVRIVASTKAEHVVAIRMLEEVIGSKPVAEITPQDIGAFKRSLLAAPSRYTLRFPGKTIPEAIEANRRRKEPFPTLDPVTVQKKWLAHVKAILAWCVDDQIIPDSPAEKVRVAEANNRGKRTTSEIFDGADLVKLFGPHFAPDGTLGTNEWAMLLALFTGARSSSEIARLRLDNIGTEQGVLVFHLAAASKNEHSKRIVPVHRQLVEVGLMRHVEKLRAKGETSLFPDWSPEDKVNRWFLRTYKSLVGVEGKKKVFHSFRHTLKTALARAGVARDVSDLITGHQDQSVASIYIHDKDRTMLGAMAEGLNRVTFDSVDWQELAERFD